ncbi:hypothetical protein C0W54_14355 [Photobacterium kishitanii]|uniref:glycosyltransferase n=1 Tax=Photobacterium kishitanii TaxID=318456 RepID=UPI000D170EF9|nr:glycosyltransferase [Photobacterium kishitanii]PSW60656.1 hypothetical protein C0W54_14355 [Photobacterium kishitanii]
MKKILFIIPKLSNGGIERVASNLSMGLSSNFEQKIFSIMNQSDSYQFRVKPTVVDKEVSSSYFYKFFVFISRLLNLYRIKEKNIISFSLGERCNLLNMIVNRGDIRVLSCHSVISIENSSKGWIGFIYNYLAKKLYNKADCIIAVSQPVKDDLIINIGIDENKIHVINNGYSIGEIQELAKEDITFIKDETALNIITVSRITYAKGIIYQLYILKKLLDLGCNCHLYIVGADERDLYSEKLDLHIKKLGLTNDITFLGYQKNVYPYIYQCDLFLLTSIFEGFAGVLIESLSCKTPFLTSACKGPVDIVRKDKESKCSKYLGEFSGQPELTKSDIVNIDLFVDNIINFSFNNDYCIPLAKEFDIAHMIKDYERLFVNLY